MPGLFPPSEQPGHTGSGPPASGDMAVFKPWLRVAPRPRAVREEGREAELPVAGQDLRWTLGHLEWVGPSANGPVGIYSFISGHTRLSACTLACCIWSNISLPPPHAWAGQAL